MEAALQEHSPSSIMQRVQKIRDRMYIEQASGISLADKATFLVLCLQYEQRPFDERRAISSQQMRLYARRQMHAMKNSDLSGQWAGFEDGGGFNDWDKCLDDDTESSKDD